MFTEQFTLVKKLILQSSQLSWYTLSKDYSTRTTMDSVKLPKLPTSQVNK